MSNGDSSDAPSRSEADEALRQLAHVTLSPTLSRRSRAHLAASLADRALTETADYADARIRLLRSALTVGARRRGIRGLVRSMVPGDRRDPATQDAEARLAAMMPATRAAYGLLRLERLTGAETTELLRWAGVTDPETATALADRATLEPDTVRAMMATPSAAVKRPRLVAAGAMALVVAVAAPVIAATTSDDAEPATTQVAQVSPTDPKYAGMSPAVRALAMMVDELGLQLADERVTGDERAQLAELRTTAADKLQKLLKLDDAKAERPKKKERGGKKSGPAAP